MGVVDEAADQGRRPAPPEIHSCQYSSSQLPETMSWQITSARVERGGGGPKPVRASGEWVRLYLRPSLMHAIQLPPQYYRRPL